jgi:hypothetical protein
MLRKKMDRLRNVDLAGLDRNDPRYERELERLADMLSDKEIDSLVGPAKASDS